MVEKISAENAYVRSMMDKLPDNAKGQKYTIKRGDSLWNLAKAELNKTKQATNAEISKYMLLIAKLNGLDTVEKMNSIKAEETIYMPDTEFVSARELINPEYVDKEVPLTSAEQSFENVMDIVLNDESIITKKVYPHSWDNSTMYHVYTQRNDRASDFSNASPVLSFSVNKDGNVDDIAFEDVNCDTNRYGYDYNLNRDGTIVTNDYHKQNRGKISGEDFQKFETKLKNLAGNCITYTF